MQIELLNLQGCAVRTMRSGVPQAAGAHDTTLDLADLPSGLYRVVFTHDGYSTAQPLLITH